MIWRIRGRAAFARLAREGRRARAGPLWCSYLLEPSAVPPRVAFALGRALGSAPVRNRARRRLRALVASSDLPPGWYLIGATPAIVERAFDALARDMSELLESVRAAASSSGSSSDTSG